MYKTIDHILEPPSNFSIQQAQKFAMSVSQKQKKKLGQFFTPRELATFMASMFDLDARKKIIRILDPGCGTLTLTCTLLEKIFSSKNSIEEVEIDAYDTDLMLVDVIQKVIKRVEDWGHGLNKKITINYRSEDFLLDFKNLSNKKDRYDYIISNPPYFKIGKEDPRLKIISDSFSGQQNIYCLFILTSLDLLNKNGQMVYLIPRSFTSGLYFQSFREHFLKVACINRLHVFISRTDGFRKDNVLQENIIMKASLRRPNESTPQIQITTSKNGKDIGFTKAEAFDEKVIIKDHGPLKVIYAPTNEKEIKSLRVITNFRNNLTLMGMKVSTGPVVPFRSREFLRQRKGNSTKVVPLFWMQNCYRMNFKWPNRSNSKPEWIVINDRSSARTIANKDYVLLRRFSSKDDHHKVVAAPYFKDCVPYNEIGIENHLNYLHGNGGDLSKEEILGLAALYNSSLYDSFFRSLGGSTQINASELNNIPMPDTLLIRKIGRMIKQMDNKPQNMDLIDNIVANVLELDL